MQGGGAGDICGRGVGARRQQGGHRRLVAHVGGVVQRSGAVLRGGAAGGTQRVSFLRRDASGGGPFQRIWRPQFSTAAAQPG